MSDIKIDVTPTSVSEDDPSRKELLWYKRQEKLLLKWSDELIIKKKHHNRKGKFNMKLYYILGIPNIIIPLVVGSTDLITIIEPLKLSILLISNAVFAGVTTFMNFSKKTQLHFEYEAKYSELAVSIEKELCIPKAHRVAADVFLERIQSSYNYLNSNAPE